MLSFACVLVKAQSAADWQTLSPEGEEFSIMMPPNPKFEEGPETYHRMTLNTRLYLSQPANGPVIAVASFSGIKLNPAMYTEVQRMNSYVDAFKNWFGHKVGGADAVAKMTLVGEKVLNGNKGREYTMTIGDRTGTAQVFATRRRFYAIVLMDKKKDEKLTERFLSSLSLPETVNAPAPGVAATEKPTTGDGAARTKKPVSTDDSARPEASVNGGDQPATDAAPSAPNAAPAKEGERAPISGGILNGKAIYLPPPDYPVIAEQAKASGTVAVQVLIDEAGNVISARAVSGHPLLQATSVAAARQARFSQTMLSGVPVKVQGIITYNFVAQ